MTDKNSGSAEEMQTIQPTSSSIVAADNTQDDRNLVLRFGFWSFEDATQVHVEGSMNTWLRIFKCYKVPTGSLVLSKKEILE
jgi:hypothetical protein